MAIQIQLRRDTETNWNTNDPILASGEIGIATNFTPAKFKIGNDTSSWTELPYVVENGNSLATLTDVLITNIQVGDLLMYQNGRWENIRKTVVVDGGNF
jgi:hypothetical protein